MGGHRAVLLGGALVLVWMVWTTTGLSREDDTPHDGDTTVLAPWSLPAPSSPRETEPQVASPLSGPQEDNVVEQIWTLLFQPGGALEGTDRNATRVEMMDTLEEFELKETAAQGTDGDLRRIATPLNAYHHQVFVNGEPEVVAYSSLDHFGALLDTVHDETVPTVFQIGPNPLCRLVQHGLSTLLHPRLLPPDAERQTVRMLVAPAFKLFALWHVVGKRDTVLLLRLDIPHDDMMDGGEQETLRTNRIYSTEEFLTHLRSEPWVESFVPASPSPSPPLSPEDQIPDAPIPPDTMGPQLEESFSIEDGTAEQGLVQ
eukprot:TRINITY_DN923_c0_g1_i3.p1 TRINITY_DN923_c0_g1~~TRINITY_DN923_c0_g1_i3.p1  ORF type:complete len:325 (-),score=67.92 TRINITY_DN923_c0_g1_i3:203-1147(-)